MTVGDLVLVTHAKFGTLHRSQKQAGAEVSSLCLSTRFLREQPSWKYFNSLVDFEAVESACKVVQISVSSWKKLKLQLRY
jgi:hypothetical protein